MLRVTQPNIQSTESNLQIIHGPQFIKTESFKAMETAAKVTLFSVTNRGDPLSHIVSIS